MRADDPLARGPPAGLSGRRTLSDDFLEGRIRTLETRVKELEADLDIEKQMNASNLRIVKVELGLRKKADADLAALSVQVLHDYRVGTTGYDLTMKMARGVGRESDGAIGSAGPPGSPAPVRAGSGPSFIAAKSAARRQPETEDGCGA